MKRENEIPAAASFMAPYAFPSSETAGRRYPEPPHPYRQPFQRDRDRIIHCAAFRRLSEKMQVFTAEFGNYHRTRLTHTLEVSCIARTIGRALLLNEDLIEAAALLHDIGHSPFGHAGEAALNTLLQDCGGFEHNAQALRIVEKLVRRYVNFPGLNLSKEILDGQSYKMTKQGVPLLEIQTADIADSIAYDTHDVDDAVEIGLLTAGQLIQTPLWKRSVKRVRQLFSGLDDTELCRAVIRDLIEIQVSDVLTASAIRLEGISSHSEARRTMMIAPSADIAGQKKEMEQFLLENVYRHPSVMLHRRRVAEWIETIFDFYVSQPDRLPVRYLPIVHIEGIKRAAGDFTADQTDRTLRAELLRYKNGFGKPLSPKNPL